MILRLYYPADSDLIALRDLLGRNFAREVRSCISSYLNGVQYQIEVPETISEHLREENLVVNLNVRRLHKQMIDDYLNRIKPNAKCDVVKTIIRSCYDRFPIELFFNNEISMMPKEEHTKQADDKKKEVIKDLPDNNEKMTEEPKEIPVQKKTENVSPVKKPDVSDENDAFGLFSGMMG